MKSGTTTIEVSGYLDGWEYLEYLRRKGKSDKQIDKLMIEPPRFEFLEKESNA